MKKVGIIAGLVVVFAVGVAAAGTLKASARAASNPPVHLVGSTATISGSFADCSDVQFDVYGPATSGSIGAGIFASHIRVGFTNGVLSFFNATFTTNLGGAGPELDVGGFTGVPSATGTCSVGSGVTLTVTGSAAFAYEVPERAAGGTFTFNISLANAMEGGNSWPVSFVADVTPNDPVAPPPGGGGSGGSGGTSVPDLSVQWTASRTQAATNDLVDLTAALTNSGGAGSLQTHLLITIPTGAALVGPPTFDRGSGCAGTTTLDCYIDYVPNGGTTYIRFEIRITGSTSVTVSANATADRDSNPADNSASVAIQVETPTPSTTTATSPIPRRPVILSAPSTITIRAAERVVPVMLTSSDKSSPQELCWHLASVRHLTCAQGRGTWHVKLRKTPGQRLFVLKEHGSVVARTTVTIKANG